MSLIEDVKLSAYWEAAQSYPFCVFPFAKNSTFMLRNSTLRQVHYKMSNDEMMVLMACSRT